MADGDLNFPMLNYHIAASSCSALMFGTFASKVFWNQMAWWHSKGRNPGASCCSFWSDRNLLLRRCLFFAKRNVELCWLILGEGPLIFSDRNIGWKEKYVGHLFHAWKTICCFKSMKPYNVNPERIMWENLCQEFLKFGSFLSKIYSVHLIPIWESLDFGETSS